MAQIIVRKLDPGVVERLKKRAVQNGRSLEAELRIILSRAANGDVAAEESASYGALDRVARSLPESQDFRRASVVRFPRVKPIQITGDLVSRRLIEERR